MAVTIGGNTQRNLSDL